MQTKRKLDMGAGSPRHAQHGAAILPCRKDDVVSAQGTELCSLRGGGAALEALPGTRGSQPRGGACPVAGPPPPHLALLPEGGLEKSGDALALCSSGRVRMDIWQSSSQPPARNLRIATLATYAGFILVHVASNLGWLGATNADVSAKFPVPLTPAGWAFSIWGVIFLLEGWGVVYQAMDDGYDADGFKARFANATNVNWIASWLAAAAWQFVFVQQTPGGMWLAFVLILTAFLAMARAQAQLYAVKDRFGPAPSLPLYAAFFLGTSINTAWLSVATCVQLLIALKMPMAGSSLDVPSVMAAAAVTCLGTWVLLKEHDTAYGLTLVWALVAVFEHTDVPLVRHSALAAIVVLAALSIASVLRRPGPPPQYEHGDAREPLRSGVGLEDAS